MVEEMNEWKEKYKSDGIPGLEQLMIEKKEKFIVDEIEKANKEWDKKDAYYAKILIPIEHVPLQRVMMTKFQLLFNKEQRKIVDQELHDLSYHTWVQCRDANWLVKRAMRDWLLGLDSGTVLTNGAIIGIIITAALLLGILMGRGL